MMRAVVRIRRLGYDDSQETVGSHTGSLSGEATGAG